MRPYQEAKSEADKYLVESGLDYTILRPGGLTDDPGTGKVPLGESWSTGRSRATTSPLCSPSASPPTTRSASPST